ncbi:MAG: hypothetical protein BGO70_09260 [Bacteroidetes bacterium 43-93]|nr:response regulator [Bacteroidota bacterium]OJX00351.1 MAG: hypothetical protein BGO70_09260 [Bacteroidetes bacterium 43-93]
MSQHFKNYTNVKIVYVDDDVDDRFLFTEVLREIDPDIALHTLTNGQELINELDNIAEQPTLIFLDVNMPGYNGFECLSYIRGKSMYDDISVYLLSTSATEKNVETAQNLGANGYLNKPTSYGDLKTLICNCIESVLST